MDVSPNRVDVSLSGKRSNRVHPQCMKLMRSSKPLQVAPEEQQLFYNDTLLEESKSLVDCGLNTNTAKAQSPATIGLAIGKEPLEITQLSLPPELPDVMKGQDSAVDPACA